MYSMTLEKKNLVQSPDIETDRDNYFEYFTCKKPPYISIIDYLSPIQEYYFYDKM